MQIFLRFPNSAARLVEITQVITSSQPTIKLKLPFWRPGRYESQNYAKNILHFTAIDAFNQKLPHHKEDRDTWVIQNNLSEYTKITYQYYAYQLDAGGSYIDDDIVYLNPVNMCMQWLSIEKPIELFLQLPPTYKISCGLAFEKRSIKNEDFLYALCNSWYELYDSPVMASSNLLEYTYIVQNTAFTLWFYGIKNLAKDSEIIDKFVKFTEYQYQIFGSFPFVDYHFQFLILPFKYYHGVEHRNSTVIVLGNNSDFSSGVLDDDFYGISSHELFHAWNICKIRPTELSPYDYTRASYFNTGFVAEGFTTYYGDYVLYRSGVINKAQYQQELETILQRHFANPGNLQYSLAESSLDLWVDGYLPSHPERKVSIYDKGALISLILDAHIQKLSDGLYSLDHVLQELWHNFGKLQKPYTERDIYTLVERYAGEGIKSIYNECVFGKTYLSELLIEALRLKDLQINWPKVKNTTFYEKGFQYTERNGSKIIDKLNPEHSNYQILSISDEIINEEEFSFTVLRNGRLLNLKK